MNDPDIPAALRLRRAFVIAAAALTGVLAFVSMMVDPAPEADGPDMVAAYAADLTASGLHTNLLHYGFVLMAPVVFASVGLVQRRGAALANVAGLLGVLGLTTLPGLVLTDFWSVAALRATGDLGTLAAMDAELETLTWFTVIAAPAFVGALLAMPIAVTALWRAGLVPALLVPIAFIAGLAPNFGPTWWLSWGPQLIGMLVVAFYLARIPTEHWYGGVAASADARDEVTV